MGLGRLHAPSLVPGASQERSLAPAHRGSEAATSDQTVSSGVGCTASPVAICQETPGTCLLFLQLLPCSSPTQFPGTCSPKSGGSCPATRGIFQNLFSPEWLTAL